MATTLEVSYFNTFWLKRLKNFAQEQKREQNGAVTSTSGGTTTGTPNLVTGAGYINNNSYEDWFVEEARIKGGYNNTSVDFGNKAYIVEEESEQITRQNALIYSGVYNAKNGINNTNQFPIGEDITRSVDPASGSIQKLYAENTNLIILQERKVNRAPIDKDVIFTQEGQPLQANSRLVIGTPTAFEGNFGISQDPGSFAVYGYNKYFVDRDRSAVLKLGANGITEISNYGMIDYFRDILQNLGGNEPVTTLSLSNEITGGFDIYQKNYVVTLGGLRTLHFDPLVNGWVSFQDYIPQLSTSSQGQYYTFKNNAVWLQYSSNLYNNFYGKQYGSSVDFVFNPIPTITKTFKTISYTGSNGWSATNITTDKTGIDTNPQDPLLPNTNATYPGIDILNYDDGYYVDPNSQVEYRAGFDRKQNVYYAALKGSSTEIPQQVLINNATTGIKGMFLNVRLKTGNNATDTDPVQLFSVGSSYNNR